MLDKTADALSIAHAGRRGAFIREVKIDFAENNADAAEVVQAIPVAAGEFVERVFVQVVAPEGAAAVGDIGDGDDTDGYLVDVDLNAAGWKAMQLTLTEGAPNTVAGYSNGKLYAADDTIDLIPDVAMDAGVVRVMALIINLND